VASRTHRSSRRRPRRRLSAPERREAILAAAVDVFSRSGFQGASIDAIARRAGISKALIYEHFPSKQDLRAAVLEDHVAELFRRLAESAATDEPGEVRLRAGVEAFLAFVEERRAGWRMIFRDAADPAVARVVAGLQEQVTLAVAALIAADPAAAASSEPDREVRIEMLATLLTGAVQSLALWWDDHAELPRERIADAVMEFAWLGLDRVRAGERVSQG
jgi:AcrR family transcriptional regulator